MKKPSFKKILSKMGKKNIAIMGHMGSGKSVLGKKIAIFFSINHIDTDKKIELRENSSINEIFLSKGEEYFRKQESKVILEILNNKKNVIISLGGGSILNKEIRQALKKHSFSIFLDTKLTVLNQRLKRSKKRPLLKKGNILTTLKKLDKERRKYYLNADLYIENSLSLSNTFATLIDKFSSLDV